MKLRRWLNGKMLAVANCLALALVLQSANSACCWLFHQPDFPKEAAKYRKAE